MKKEEIIMRLNLMNTTLSGKLENRVTSDRFNRAVEKIETKVESVDENCNYVSESFEKL